MTPPKARFLAALVWGASQLCSPAEQIYFIGNSVTDAINYAGLSALAQADGKTLATGRQMIPGAPLEVLWASPTGGFVEPAYGYPSQALSSNAWNFLSLQPFDRLLTHDTTDSKNFLGLLYGGATPTAQQTTNRNLTRVLIYGRWPRQDDATRPGGPRDYGTLWLRSYNNSWDNSNETADYFRQLVNALRADSVSGIPLADRVFLVPVGEVFYDLHQQIQAGLVPGYTSVFQFYTDGIHLTGTGSYVAACTYYAVCFQKSPVGLPVPSQFGSISPDLALRIQQAVWNVVSSEPLAGVSSDGSLRFTTSALPPGMIGAAYSAAVSAAGGTAPRSFALTSGQLPQGLAFGTNGVINGTPTTAGTFSFTIQAQDAAAATANATYQIRIDADTTPAITTAAALPSVGRVDRVDISLTATGGNPTLSWTLVSGSLPTGISLGAGGRIIGTALSEGLFQPVIRVTDADGDTDTRTFSLQVGAPGNQTVLIPRTLSSVRVDGELAETHWSLRTATQVRQGTPDNALRFGLLWDPNYLYIAVEVTDDELVGGTDGDAVEIFLDALHDGQAEFNSQHRHLRLTLDGSLWERGSRVSGIESAMVPVPGGFRVEMKVPWTNLGITPTADTTAIGVDIGNRDVDGTGSAYLAFAGVDAIDPRPSQFGHALLASTTVSGSGGELPPAGGSPVVHEPFDGPARPLHGASGGIGFSGAWQVEGDATGGYILPDGNSLTYGDLPVSGLRLSGGDAWRTSGRALAVTSPALATWKRDGENSLGKAGTTLWLSFLARPASPSTAMKVVLDDGGAIYHDNNGTVRVLQDGGQWRVSLMNGAAVSANAGALVGGRTDLLVLRLDFGATNTASLYVNPPVGDAPPGSPTATAAYNGTNLRFDQLILYPGNSPGNGEIDEVRMGATWADVVPRPPAFVAPVRFVPAGGTYSEPVAVTMASSTAGAVIRYTLDGSEPGPASPLYAGPVTVSATGTLRARAFGTGGTQSVSSGATYTMQDSFTTWNSGIPWAGRDASPAGDPDGDGLSNLLEWALGADPLAQSSAQQPASGYDTSGPTPRLSLTFTPRQVTTVQWWLEASSDLSAWDAFLLGGLTKDQSATVYDPEPGGTKRFLRLRASLP